MGAAYTIGGVLVGIVAARVSSQEPAWAWLIAPAAVAFTVGWVHEWVARGYR